jgi:outer membrane biosynthesis protein TonB
MKPLSKTQRSILTAASKEPKLPIEEHMARYKSPAVRRQIAYSLLCSGYVTEDGDHHYITDEGIAALSGKAKAKAEKPAKKEKQKKLPAPRTPKVKKAAEPKAEKPAKAPKPEKASAADDVTSDKPAEGRQLLINMMSRDEGATSQQMVKATGWQSGAIGGTLSKIRKLIAPQVITSSKGEDGKLIYKIAK